MKATHDRNGPSRRSLLATAGTAGVVATAASLLPSPAGRSVLAVDSGEAGSRARGYRLTGHIKHYYRTTLV